MEEKRLYPFSFCPLEDNYPWGTDTFLLADLGYRDSIVRDGWLAMNTMSEIMDTYMDRVVGENAYTFWGRQFPVQLRRLRINGTMPLRVHPDDETAEQRYDLLGRDKLWYVLSAEPGARILAGWKQDTNASEVYHACTEGSAEKLLCSFPVQKGSFLHIAPGTPHSASGKLDILEVSESSALDFLLSAMGTEVHPDEFDPSLSLVDALDFIDYKAYDGKVADAKDAPDGVLAEVQSFRVERRRLDGPLSVGGEADTFAIYLTESGAAALKLDIMGTEASFKLPQAAPMLVPAETGAFAVVPTEKDTVIIEVTVPLREERDRYIQAE